MTVVSTTPRRSIEYDRIVPGEKDEGSKCETELPPLSNQQEVVSEAVNARRYGEVHNE